MPFPWGIFGAAGPPGPPGPPGTGGMSSGTFDGAGAFSDELPFDYPAGQKGPIGPRGIIGTVGPMPIGLDCNAFDYPPFAQSTAIIPDAISSAAANVGKFTANTINLNATGVGPDLVIGTTIVVCFFAHGVEPVGVNAPFSLSGVAESVLTNCTNTTGWDIEFAQSGILRLVVITGVQTPSNWSERIVPGLNCLALTVAASGAINASLNGGAAFQLVATGFAYANAGVTAKYIVGGINTARVASGQPATDVEVVYVGVIGASLSNADLATVTNQINLVERYLPSTVLSGHVSLTSLWQATDWDGVSGTTTAGAGGTPTTWTVAGALTKNTISQELYYKVKPAWFQDAGLQTVNTYQVGSDTYTLRNAFSRIRFQCNNPSRLIVDVAADTLDGVASLGLQCTGLRVANVPQGVGRWINEVGLLRSTDWLNGSFDSGGTSFELVDGIRSLLAANGAVHGCSIQAIRVPIDTPILSIQRDTVTPGVGFTFLGDSIVGNGNATAPCTAGWTTLTRTNMLAANFGTVQVLANGFGAWKDQCVDAAAITNSLNALTANFTSATNYLIICLGTNDYGLNEWTTTGAGNFEDRVGAWFTAFATAFPSVKVLLITPLTRAVETANTFGKTLGDYRTSLANVAALFPAQVTLLSGPSLMDVGLLDSGGVHPTQVGHVCLEYMLARALTSTGFPSGGYTPQQPWLSNGTIYPDNRITDVWIADAADTGNVGAGNGVATFTRRKGANNFVQVTGTKQPIWNSNWGATNPFGTITFDGVDDFMSANGVAAPLSGNDTPFSFTMAAAPLTIGVSKQMLSFSRSTTATQSFQNFTQLNTNKMTNTRAPDTGASNTVSSTQNLDTSKQVFTDNFVQAKTTIRRNGIDTSVAGTSNDVATMTLDQLTLACFFGNGVGANFSNLRVRALVGRFDGVVTEPLVFQINEGYLLGELRYAA